MRKIILICIAFVSIGYIANAQQLTINETVAYINQSIGNKDKFALSSDGYITYSQYRGEKDYGWSMQEYNYTMIAYFKVHISDILSPNIIVAPHARIYNPFYVQNSTSAWVVPFKCKAHSCIQFWTSLPKNKVSEKNYFSSFEITSGGDKYSTEKLLNAFQYLFALAQEKGMFGRVDNDPFAPQNYNPNAIEIKSSSNNGSIKLSKQAGVYHIPITIGGITRSFVFDTGASDVLISEDYERALIQNGTIKKEHYLTPALYRIADGSIVQQRRLIIPQLTIGNFTITNVQTTIGVGYVPLLLGKSVLSKFKSWSIDNLTETLNLEK